MEVKIGVQYAPREIVLETNASPDEVEKLLHEALKADFGLFTLVDDKGRKVFIPAEKIAYVELGEPEGRKVGFGPSADVLPCHAFGGRGRLGRRPSWAIRLVCASVSRASILPSSTRPPDAVAPPTIRSVSASRSTATRWAWTSASPTSRRAHSASRPATLGSASIAARTRSTAKPACPLSESTSATRACGSASR